MNKKKERIPFFLLLLSFNNIVRSFVTVFIILKMYHFLRSFAGLQFAVYKYKKFEQHDAK